MRARRLVLFSFAVMCVATIASIAPRPASAYDHVRNGSFESSTDGWTVRGDATLTITGGDEVAPVEGSRVAKVSMSDARFEALTATDGALDVGAYHVTASVLTTNDGMLAGASLAGATSHLRPLTPGLWTMIEFTVNLTSADRATLGIVATGQPGDVLYIDAVHIQGAPPVTLTPTPTLAPPRTPAADATGTPPPTSTVEPTATAIVDVIAHHLRNTSFEETTVDGLPFAWQKFGGDLSTSPEHPRSGSLAARLDSNTASTKWLYQTVVVDPLETYAFAAWIYRDDPDVASAFLRISWYASNDGSGEAIASGDSPHRLDTPSSAYRHITTGPLTAPPEARSAKLRIMLSPASAAPATIFVDDASFAVTEPPPPDATPGTAAPAAASSSPQSGPARSTRSARTSSGLAFDATQRLASYDGNAPLVINEVLYDPDTDADDAAGEWVEIYNPGNSDVPLAGWSLRDNARAVALPDVIIPARDFAIIAASDSFFAAYPEFDGLAAWLEGRIGNGLGNDGDRLELLAPDATVIDAISWGDESSILDPPIEDVPSGHSIERRTTGADTDSADDFVDNDLPSPGVAVEAAAANSKQRIGASGVEIIESARQGRYAWAPWALVAISAAALAGSVGWRALDFVRGRSRSA